MKHIKCLGKLPITIILLCIVSILLIPGMLVCVLLALSGCSENSMDYWSDIVTNLFDWWRNL